MAGCDCPPRRVALPARQPEDEDEVIRPAREGTLRVLRAAWAAGMKRIVVTSSFAAVGYSHGQRDTPYDEGDWTDPADPASALHEVQDARRARRMGLRRREGNDVELTVVNPVGISGRR